MDSRISVPTVGQPEILSRRQSLLPVRAYGLALDEVKGKVKDSDTLDDVERARKDPAAALQE